MRSVMNALMSIGRLVRQRGQGETMEIGTFWLLKIIGQHGSMRATDLAACASLDISTVSRHVTQLHRNGLIDRGPDPDDGRAQRVELSPEGRSQLDAALQARIALLARTLDGWGPDDLDQLDHLLTRFVGDLDTLTHDLETA